MCFHDGSDHSLLFLLNLGASRVGVVNNVPGLFLAKPSMYVLVLVLPLLVEGLSLFNQFLNLQFSRCLPVTFPCSPCTRTGRPGRVQTLNQLVRSGVDHRVPVTQDPIAVMVCDLSIIWHYSRIIDIIAKYHITVLFRGINRPLLGFPLCL